MNEGKITRLRETRFRITLDAEDGTT